MAVAYRISGANQEGSTSLRGVASVCAALSGGAFVSLNDTGSLASWAPGAIQAAAPKPRAATARASRSLTLRAMERGRNVRVVDQSAMSGSGWRSFLKCADTCTG